MNDTTTTPIRIIFYANGDINISSDETSKGVLFTSKKYKEITKVIVQITHEVMDIIGDTSLFVDCQVGEDGDSPFVVYTLDTLNKLKESGKQTGLVCLDAVAKYI